jgi:predicted nuclease of predicted toxin-antitoxin system
MSQPRFLADQDFNEHIVTGVARREPAIEFLRLRDIGLERRPDSEVLAYAATEGWLVVSHDVNTMIDEAFARVVAGEPLSGLFMVRQRGAIAPVIESLVLIWSASEAEEWRGRVVYLPI